MNVLTFDIQNHMPLSRSDSTQSIQLSFPSQFLSESSLESEEEFTCKQNSGKTEKTHSRVTTIQEYTQLVIKTMKKNKKMNTTQVARAILSSVHPKTSKLTVNIRRRVGDALSVLTAINLVEKQSNGYIWRGGQSKQAETSILLNEVETLKQKLESKKQQYKALQQKEQQYQQSALLARKPSFNLITQSNPSYCKHDIDLESCLDSSQTLTLELDSPTHIHFNEYEEDVFHPFPSIIENSSRYPSISFPQCTADECLALTGIN